MPISINVNVDKIDKARFFKGKKGRYIDLVLWETPDSDYGDYMVTQRASAGERMPILGNGKYFDKKSDKKGTTANDESKPKSDQDPW